jgi:phage terminase large subunit GpA-like protein
MSVSLIAASTPALAPRPLLSVSEWADAYRMLPDSSAARGGRWRTRDTPYLKAPMNAALEPGIRELVLMGAAQVGKSEALHNILAYFMVYDPCAILLVHPAMTAAEEWSKERLTDMILTTDALREVIDESKSTLTFKMFAGGFLALGGANTPNTFARRAARLAAGDDVDRFPAVVGDEGDPADLLKNRTRTFLNGLVIMVSTPTLKKGRIDTRYERSDQRRLHLTCPACGRMDWATWSDATHFHVAYEGRDATTARLVCPGCGARMAEPERRRMVAAAADDGWIATAVAQEAGLVGFHLPALISTLGDVTLARLVEKWLSARELGKESLRVFINTTLAEGWEDRGARMNPHALGDRKEDYGDGIEVPAGAVALTAGVDVQDNRFEVLVQAWGLGGEKWVVDWKSVPGDPKKPETRQSLFAELCRKYRHASGHQLPIHATCIDTGYATDEVYDFVFAHQARRIYATKGIGGRSGEPTIGKPSEKRTTRPVRLYPVNVDDAKGDVMGALSVLTPGPGYLHFPAQLDTIDEEFFAQLCAEHRETRYNRQGVATHTIWVQDRERNEALDCAVLALVAFKLLNPNILQMLGDLPRTPPPPEPGSAATPEQPSPKPAPAQRQFSRSSYLGG